MVTLSAWSPAEELAPVPEESLVLGELVGQSPVVGETAQRFHAVACFERRQFVIGDIFILQLVEFFVDGGGNLVVGVAGQRITREIEEVGKLDAPGSPLPPSTVCAIPLIATRLRQRRSGAPVGEDIGDGVS